MPKRLSHILERCQTPYYHHCPNQLKCKTKGKDKSINLFSADSKIKLQSAEPTEALNARPTLKLLDPFNTIHLTNYCSSLIFILSISLNCSASKFCTKISGNGQLFGIYSALSQLFYSIIF